MSRGNSVIVSSDPTGKFDEGIAGAECKTGIIVQPDLSVALEGGRFTWVPFNRAADGDKPAGPLMIVRENYPIGGPLDDTFAIGQRLFLYAPKMGEELNSRVLDVAGTGDDHPAGEVMVVDDGTGKLVVAGGSERTGPFLLQETITDPTADTLAWVRFTGF